MQNTYFQVSCNAYRQFNFSFTNYLPSALRIICCREGFFSAFVFNTNVLNSVTFCYRLWRTRVHQQGKAGRQDVHVLVPATLHWRGVWERYVQLESASLSHKFMFPHFERLQKMLVLFNNCAKGNKCLFLWYLLFSVSVKFAFVKKVRTTSL